MGTSEIYQTIQGDMQNNPMKAQHFLQISSAIIGKHRHRSGVTVNKDINLALKSAPPRSAGAHADEPHSVLQPIKVGKS